MFMTSRPRSGNNPKRRVAAPDSITAELLDRLQKNAKYVGSGHHKRNPVDYGFDRSSPRPTKSLCDANRSIRKDEASALLRRGLEKKMVSAMKESDEFPKYIWSVSDQGEVFEAKTHANTPGEYHGYPLENDDDLRDYIAGLWNNR